MRKTAIAAMLLSTMIAAPAAARDNSWYAGLDFGLMKVQDIDYDLSRAGVETDNAYSADHKTGYDFGGNLGYDFGMFRTEFEVAYKSARLDAVDALGGIGFVQPAGSYNTPGGSTRALSFMLNGLLDFGGEASPWSAFVGGGVGIARVQASNTRYVRGNVPTTIVDDSDSGFAWQALAGVRRAISDNVDMSLKYRYFNAPNVDLVSSLGDDLSGKMRSHSLLLGLTYNFGKKAEAAPPPPPPPPAPVAEVAPPPPPPPAPAPGPFIVFFDWDKAEITPEAADILNRASEAFQQTGQVSVMLAGHADRSGTDQYNQGLSERRAAVVREYMAGKGVSTGAITSEAFGESRPLVETADGVREPQNRRVEINFSASAGN